MTRPIVNEFNVETQELVVREMNDEEYAQHLLDSEEAEELAAARAAEATAAEAKRAAKAEALAALGLSQEVINLLAD
jgi:hypothetical protein